MKPLLPQASAVAALLALLALAACGPPSGVARAKAMLDRGDYVGARRAADDELARTPNSHALWRIKIRAALLGGDSKAAVTAYASYRERRTDDDTEALEEMAKLTLWRGLLAPSSDLKIAAIAAIERHEILRLADEVGELIASDDDAVSAAAAIALLRDHPQAAGVAAALLSSRLPRARAIVVRGIGRKITKRAANELRAALTDPDVGVRLAGIAGLIRLRDPADVSLLSKLATADADGSVRARAGSALAGRRAPAGADDLTRVARALLADTFLGARLAGVTLARRTAGGRELLRAAARGTDVAVALRAAVALGKGPAWKPLLASALASPQWPMRVAALGAVLEATDRETAIAAANAAVTDPQLEVRIAAARLFYRLGDRARALSLLQLAVAIEPPSIAAATELVTRFDDRRGHAAIEAVARDGDRGARARAIAAHRVIGRVTPSLVAALADPAPALRMTAADVMLAQLEKP